MSDTPQTDEAAFVAGPPNDRHDVVTVQFAEQLERELNAANSKLSTVFQWINRNHPDGFIDSLTHLQNLDRVSDLHHERIDQLEAALSGRTVSCSNCNALAKENAELKKAADIISGRESELIAKYCRAKDENAAMREVINGVYKILQSIQCNDIFEDTMRNYAVIALSKLQPFITP